MNAICCTKEHPCLKILLVGHSLGPDSMEKHVFLTLRTMGHEVRHFNIYDMLNLNPKFDRYMHVALRMLSREPERLVERKIVKAVREYGPDIVLVLLGNMLSPKTVERMRGIHRGPIVCWCQDQLTTMGRQYLIGAGYDMIFVKDHYIVDFLRNMAGHQAVYYLPEACNPEFHRSIPASEAHDPRYQSDICTFATLYYYRQAILEPLCKYDLKVWGNVPDWLINRIGTRHMGAVVHEDEKRKAVACAKIVLNTLHYGEINGLNCRAFEIAGCGGFQLMTYSPAISQHFEIGKEVEVFRNRQELLDKIDYYLDRPEMRRQIAHAGQARAHAEHTYEKRLSELLERTSTV